MQNSNKRTVNLDGHITSVFLEKEFWEEIVSLSKQNNTTPDRLISDIDQKKTTSNLSIKKSMPGRRKSFRARHRCDTSPPSKLTARFWSCKNW